MHFYRKLHCHSKRTVIHARGAYTVRLFGGFVRTTESHITELGKTGLSESGYV